MRYALPFLRRRPLMPFLVKFEWMNSNNDRAYDLD